MAILQQLLLPETRLRGGHQRGFSLIELVVALAILAILVAVAVPTYTNYTLRSARADAIAVLSDVRMQQERHRLSNPAYAANLASLSIDSTSTYGRYTVAIGSAGAASFTATATPTSAQAADDCGTFAINQNGPVTTSGFASSACWRR